MRVPRLKGGRKGVFATRSPHRPCPIGLTVAKVRTLVGFVTLRWFFSRMTFLLIDISLV